MGKKDPAPAPDIVGAAEKEGRYSKDIAREATYADRPDQFNAFGSNTWDQQRVTDPATGEKVTKWTQNQEFNPRTQNLFDSGMTRNQNLVDMSNGMDSRIQDEMGGAPDWEQFGDVIGFDPNANRQEAEDAAYGRSTQRLDPRFESQQAALETQMANRGLRPGDAAYDSAMKNFDTGRNDAYEMAQMGAVSDGREEVGLNMSTNERANALRSQKIQEYLGKRGQSLSESNALMDSQNLTEMTQNFGGGE